MAPDGSSKEVTLKKLESWHRVRTNGRRRRCRAVLCGVSTRDMPSLRESELKGQSKKPGFPLVAAEIRRVGRNKCSKRICPAFDLVVLMLDAVVLSAGLVATVALGINAEGEKKVLGFRVGSSGKQAGLP